MKAYSIHRPIDIGTYPKGDMFPVKEIVNYEEKTYQPEIDRKVWGYVEYEKTVPKKILDKYELVAQEFVVAECWTVLCVGHELSMKKDKNPLDVVKYTISKVGQVNLINCLSAYALFRSWDERISSANRQFLKENGHVAIDAGGNYLTFPLHEVFFDKIHPAHVNQIIEELRKSVSSQVTEEE